jgi:hypothetical protein
VLTDLFVDGHTRMVGASRGGLPYIGEGQRVHVDARTCQVKGAVGPKIIARRVVVSGPVRAPSDVAAVLGPDWAGSAGDSHRPVVLVLIVIAALAVAAGAFAIRHRRTA